MSITKAQRARLGVFLVSGGVLLALFTIVTLGLRFRNREKTYYASWQGETLSGLEMGAAVKYHGIRIGFVDDISYDEQNINSIRVTLKIDPEFPIKTDMYAQLWMMGVTFQMYIDIMGGSNEAPLLQAGSEIPTKPSMMSAISGKADVIVAKIEQLVTQLNIATHPDSLRAVREILTNVADITSEARSFMGTLRPNVENVAASASSVLARVDSISKDIHGVTRELRGELTGGEFGRIITSIDTTAQAVKNLSETMDLTLRQSREDITVSLENLREALENANELTKILAENPSLLLRSDQQRERQTR